MTRKKLNLPFTDGNVFIGFILVFVVSFLIMQVLGFGFERILKLTIPVFQSFGRALSGLIILICFYFLYRPEFNFKELKEGFLLSLIFVFFWAALIVFNLLTENKFKNPEVNEIGLSLSAGICEETIFRFVLITYLVRNIKDERKSPFIVGITALLFGVMHGANVINGGDVGKCVLQMISATFIGVFFGAVFIRCKNIVPLIILHTLHNLIVFSAFPNTATAIQSSDIFYAIISVFYLIIGICLVKKHIT